MNRPTALYPFYSFTVIQSVSVDALVNLLCAISIKNALPLIYISFFTKKHTTNFNKNYILLSNTDITI